MGEQIGSPEAAEYESYPIWGVYKLTPYSYKEITHG